jgi:hypothetical protein
MKFALTLVTTVCLLVAASVRAAQKDPQVSFEPRSSPGAGQKLLEQFAGDWTVIKTFYPRAGDPIRAEGRCHQAMIHEGRFLQSDFTFDQNGRKTTGLGIIGFEPDSGAFTSFWTDSRQTRMSVRQSQDRFDGKRIVLYSRSIDPGGNDSRRSKTISQLEDAGRKLVHRQYALGPGGEERLMMEIIMTRDPVASLSAPRVSPARLRP